MLDYSSPQPVYQPTREDNAWFWRRAVYHAAQALLFLMIVYRIGPNLFLFHSPFSPTPADYATMAQQHAPLIAAIKAYQRDTGSLPEASWNLPPQYKPAGYTGGGGMILGYPTITIQDGISTVLEYDFRPGSEGWNVYAPRYYGPIPASKVPAAPSPATVPATTTNPNGIS